MRSSESEEHGPFINPSMRERERRKRAVYHSIYSQNWFNQGKSYRKPMVWGGESCESLAVDFSINQFIDIPAAYRSYSVNVLR